MSLPGPNPTNPRLPAERTPSQPEGDGAGGDWISDRPSQGSNLGPELRTIVAGLSDAVTIQSPDGQMLFANAEAAGALGFPSVAELMATPPADVVRRFELLDEEGAPLPPDRLPTRAALGGGRPPPTVIRFRVRQTGEQRWSILTSSPIFDEQQKLRCVVNIFRDITAQKRSEVTLRFLAEASAIFAGSLDQQTTLRSLARLAVPHVADWCAIDLLEEDGHIEQVAVAHVDPAKIELARAIRQQYPPDPDAPHGVPNVIRTGEAEMVPEITDEMLAATARSADHYQVMIAFDIRSYIVVPLTARGKILGALTLVATESQRRFDEADLALARELASRAALAVDNARLHEDAQRLAAVHAARREAEVARLRTQQILDSIREPFFVLDGSFRFIYVNAQAAELAGAPRESLLGESVWDKMPQLRGTDAERAYRRALSSGNPVSYDVPEPIDGEWYEVHVYPTLDGVSVAYRDVSARKRAEDALDDHAKELARSNAELEQFAYVASHDLQEPLRMVASYTQLLARRYRGKLDSDADEFIQYAVEGVTRMQGLIRDLLEFSRVGTRGRSFATIPITAALGRALDNLRAAIEESGARITAGALPTIWGDEAQLAQVFQNLIGNAIKFRGEGPPEVNVSAERKGQEWQVCVEDKGIGIAPEFAARIFVIFQRLHSRSEYPGNGIGLAICKKIVERHGGRIWVESEPGRGARFYFTLPPSPEENTSA
jgi:PAS domain S-box-containing protein